MRVLILAPGSWGDVSPAIRIAHDLIAEGHAITMVVHSDYAEAAERAGCATARFATTLTPPEPAAGEPAIGARSYLAHLRRYMVDHAEAALRSLNSGTVDAVLTNPISPYGHDIAEALGVPSAEALLQPSAPSRSYPPMIASAVDFGPLLNREIGRAAQRFPGPVVPALIRVRERLGLPQRSFAESLRERARTGVPVHHGISPVLLPRPGDWPLQLSLDGFWWPVDDDDWRAPAELADFLADGSPPVLLTMGSIPEGGRASTALAEFASSTRRRILVQGAAGPALAEADPDRIFATGQAPHSWLLPQVATVVHQAGAGITAACARAGIPGIPVPQHTDQHFWARTMTRLGAAPPALTGRRVSPSVLASHVETAIAGAQVRSRATALAEELERVEREQGESTLPLRRWVAAAGRRTNGRAR